MIHHFIQFALRQRFLILMATVLVIVAGALSFQRMPVDAYPDLSAPRVEIITQWPGHAAEEIERLVTLPLEVEMNGVPKMVVMRSISLYGPPRRNIATARPISTLPQVALIAVSSVCPAGLASPSSPVHRD